MKYSTVLLLLFGTISESDALILEQKEAGPADVIAPVVQAVRSAATSSTKGLAQVAAKHVEPVSNINLEKKKSFAQIAPPTSMI